MSEEQIALARRAVACRGWKWMPGMATYTPVPYTSPHLGRILSGENDIFHLWRDETIPRLRDPATLGCLLALVREAWADECAGHTYDEFGHGWFFKSRVRDGDGGNVRILGQFRSELESLVAALEAAP